MHSIVALVLLLVIVLPIVALTVAQVTGTNVELSHYFTEDDGAHALIYYRVKLGHWLPKLTPWHEYAITIGDTIYVTGVRCWPALHAHEFRHVVRWHHDGWLAGFYFIRALLTFGYVKSPLELEAVTFGTANTGDFTDVNPFNYTGEPVS